MKQREPFARRVVNWVAMPEDYKFKCETWELAEEAMKAINAAFEKAATNVKFETQKETILECIDRIEMFRNDLGEAFYAERGTMKNCIHFLFGLLEMVERKHALVLESLGRDK